MRSDGVWQEGQQPRFLQLAASTVACRSSVLGSMRSALARACPQEVGRVKQGPWCTRVGGELRPAVLSLTIAYPA